VRSQCEVYQCKEYDGSEHASSKRGQVYPGHGRGGRASPGRRV
jgi:hypothetical protein